ncbi:MAG: hypothetical protein ACJ72H_21070, partial [Candidatus Sulfotelmatobacter sp.]
LRRPLSQEALLARMDALKHEITLLQLGLEELNLRFESVCRLDALARLEDVARGGQEEDLVA